MKQNKKTVPAELSYYGLYLLDYLRKYHPDKASDTGFIAGWKSQTNLTPLAKKNLPTLFIIGLPL